MDANALQGRNELANMSEGTPLKSYKKTILGKLLLRTWDTLLDSERELVFSGDPRKGDETIFDVWSEKERIYFERMNKKHFESGSLIPFVRPAVQEAAEKPYEQYSDEEIEKILGQRFLALKATLNKINSVAVLFRLLTLAKELEKSAGTVTAIEARISDVQAEEFSPKKPDLSASLNEEE